MKKHIEVVAAVIKKGDKYFCAQRKDAGELARKWEFPGGKVEKNEKLEAALERELEEELNLKVRINGFITTVNHEYVGFNLTMHAFLCSTDITDIKLNEHLDSKWLTLDEMMHLDWAAADLPIIEKLKG